MTRTTSSIINDKKTPPSQTPVSAGAENGVGSRVPQETSSSTHQQRPPQWQIFLADDSTARIKVAQAMRQMLRLQKQGNSVPVQPQRQQEPDDPHDAGGRSWRGGHHKKTTTTKEGEPHEDYAEEEEEEQGGGGRGCRGEKNSPLPFDDHDEDEEEDNDEQQIQTTRHLDQQVVLKQEGEGNDPPLFLFPGNKTKQFAPPPLVLGPPRPGRAAQEEEQNPPERNNKSPFRLDDGAAGDASACGPPRRLAAPKEDKEPAVVVTTVPFAGGAGSSSSAQQQGEEEEKDPYPLSFCDPIATAPLHSLFEGGQGADEEEEQMVDEIKNVLLPRCHKKNEEYEQDDVFVCLQTAADELPTAESLVNVFEERHQQEEEERTQQFFSSPFG